MSRPTGGDGSIRATRDHISSSNSEISSSNSEWEGWVSFGRDPVSGTRMRRKVRGATKADLDAKIDALIRLSQRTRSGEAHTGEAQS